MKSLSPALPPESQEEAQLMRRATLASLTLALFMTALKTIAVQASGSVSVFSSLLDSALDCAASLLNFMAVRYALLPADANHRFGHGKAEDMSGLGQALIISASSFYLLYESWQRLRYPTPLEHSPLAVGIMLLSLALTIGLVMYQRYAIARTGSIAIRADQAHYTMDIVNNIGVLAVLFLATSVQMWWLDGAFALFCGLYFLWGAGKIGYSAFQQLMDEEFSPTERENILAIIRLQPQAQTVRDLRTRQAGQKQFIQFCLVLDASLTLREIDSISRQIMRNLRNSYPKAEIFIHPQPN